MAVSSSFMQTVMLFWGPLVAFPSAELVAAVLPSSVVLAAVRQPVVLHAAVMTFDCLPAEMQLSALLLLHWSRQ